MKMAMPLSWILPDKSEIDVIKDEGSLYFRLGDQYSLTPVFKRNDKYVLEHKFKMDGNIGYNRFIVEKLTLTRMDLIYYGKLHALAQKPVKTFAIRRFPRDEVKAKIRKRKV